MNGAAADLNYQSTNCLLFLVLGPFSKKFSKENRKKMATDRNTWTADLGHTWRAPVCQQFSCLGYLRSLEKKTEKHITACRKRNLDWSVERKDTWDHNGRTEIRRQKLPLKVCPLPRDSRIAILQGRGTINSEPDQKNSKLWKLDGHTSLSYRRYHWPWTRVEW